MDSIDGNVILFKKEEKNLLSIANEKIECGDIEGALSVYLEIEKLGKFNLSLYREIANLYTQLEMYSESITYWFKYLNYVSKRHYAEAYNGLGGNFYLAGVTDLAAYYFNLQISDDGDDEYPFDDYIYELFYQSNDGEEKLPFKVIDTQAEVDKESIKEAKKLFEKEPKVAYELLNNIKECSAEYENACLTVAAFYMVDGNYEKAVEKYGEISSSSENYDYALNNLFGAYFCLKNYKKVDEILLLMQKLDCAEYEQLAKFFHLIRAAGDNDLAYNYSIYMRKLFSTPNLYYYSGIASYNCAHFEEAQEWFLLYYKVTNCYFAHYAIEACLAKMQGKKRYPDRLPYMFSLPESKCKELEKLAPEYFTMTKRQLSKKASEIYDFAEATLSTNKTELQIIACQLVSFIGGTKAVKYLKNLLLNPILQDIVKVTIVSLLVEMGNSGLTGMVYGNVFSRVPFEKVEFTEDQADVFLTAYAIAFGRLSPYDEEELYKLKISAYHIYYALIGNGNVKKVNDVIALASYITINAGMKIRLSAEEIIEYVGSTVEDVNKIIKLTKSE